MVDGLNWLILVVISTMNTQTAGSLRIQNASENKNYNIEGNDIFMLQAEDSYHLLKYSEQNSVKVIF